MVVGVICSTVIPLLLLMSEGIYVDYPWLLLVPGLQLTAFACYQFFRFATRYAPHFECRDCRHRWKEKV